MRRGCGELHFAVFKNGIASARIALEVSLVTVLRVGGNGDGIRCGRRRSRGHADGRARGQAAFADGDGLAAGQIDVVRRGRRGCRFAAHLVIKDFGIAGNGHRAVAVHVHTAALVLGLVAGDRAAAHVEHAAALAIAVAVHIHAAAISKDVFIRVAAGDAAAAHVERAADVRVGAGNAVGHIHAAAETDAPCEDRFVSGNAAAAHIERAASHTHTAAISGVTARPVAGDTAIVQIENSVDFHTHAAAKDARTAGDAAAVHIECAGDRPTRPVCVKVFLICAVHKHAAAVVLAGSAGGNIAIGEFTAVQVERAAIYLHDAAMTITAGDFAPVLTVAECEIFGNPLFIETRGVVPIDPVRSINLDGGLGRDGLAVQAEHRAVLGRPVVHRHVFGQIIVARLFGQAVFRCITVVSVLRLCQRVRPRSERDLLGGFRVTRGAGASGRAAAEIVRVRGGLLLQHELAAVVIRELVPVVVAGDLAAARAGSDGGGIRHGHADAGAGFQRADDGHDGVIRQIDVVLFAILRVVDDARIAGDLERAPVLHVHAAAVIRGAVAADRAAVHAEDDRIKKLAVAVIIEAHTAAKT